MLSTQNLSFNYPKAEPFTFPDLNVQAGEVKLVLGESGAGKTTLLHLLAGLLNPTSGTIQIGEQRLDVLSGAAKDRFRGSNVGIVFQSAQFVRSISVLQNLYLARTLAGLDRNETLCKELLSDLGISERMNAKPNELSVGERQRASIARALSTEPKIVLADEPTSALDDTNCLVVADLLEHAVTNRAAALVVVTHDQRLKNRFQNTVTL